MCGLSLKNPGIRLSDELEFFKENLKSLNNKPAVRHPGYKKEKKKKKSIEKEDSSRQNGDENREEGNQEIFTGKIVEKTFQQRFYVAKLLFKPLPLQ